MGYSWLSLLRRGGNVKCSSSCFEIDVWISFKGLSRNNNSNNKLLQLHERESEDERGKEPQKPTSAILETAATPGYHPSVRDVQYEAVLVGYWFCKTTFRLPNLGCDDPLITLTILRAHWFHVSTETYLLVSLQQDSAKKNPSLHSHRVGLKGGGLKKSRLFPPLAKSSSVPFTTNSKTPLDNKTIKSIKPSWTSPAPSSTSVFIPYPILYFKATFATLWLNTQLLCMSHLRAFTQQTEAWLLW